MEPSTPRVGHALPPVTAAPVTTTVILALIHIKRQGTEQTEYA